MDLLCQLKVVSANPCKFYFCIQFLHTISKELVSLCNFILGLADTGMIPAAKQNGMTALKKKFKNVHDCGITCAFVSAA